MVFWITSRMKTKREQVNEEMVVIKLFVSNYARDLMKMALSTLLVLTTQAIVIA